MVKVKESSPLDTREKILIAAREVFMAKGMEGARMQEIANRAGINKALLHYYFMNKDTLFQAVFRQAIAELLPALSEIFTSNRPMLDKIFDFFSIHISFLQDNPMIPQFIISEVSRNPDRILNGFKAFNQQKLFDKFANDVNVSIQNGEIKPVDPIQLLINLISLSVFPFVAKPLLVKLLGLDENRYDQILEERKAVVPSFIINALK